MEKNNSDFIFRTKQEAENKVFAIEKKAKEDKRKLDSKVIALSSNLSESNQRYRDLLDEFTTLKDEFQKIEQANLDDPNL